MTSGYLFLLGPVLLVGYLLARRQARLRKTREEEARLARQAELEALPLKPLSALGYWRSPDDEGKLPDPRELVGARLDAGTRSALLRYLREAPCVMTWRGYSYCRFDCGCPNTEMGSRDLSDGVWIWPQGLAHYVEVHDVRLPEAFAEHVIAQGFEPPAALSFTPFQDCRLQYDMDAWLRWAQLSSSSSHQRST